MGVTSRENGYQDKIRKQIVSTTRSENDKPLIDVIKYSVILEIVSITCYLDGYSIGRIIYKV